MNNEVKEKIIFLSLENKTIQARDIILDASLRSVQRYLKQLEDEGYLISEKSVQATIYSPDSVGILQLPINVERYFNLPTEERNWSAQGFDITRITKQSESLFSETELKRLNGATNNFLDASKNYPVDLHKKELERFIIELSWKSSRIEGNTYNLLDTEQLIKYGTKAQGHSDEEAQMILNHKKAFELIYESQGFFDIKKMTVGVIEEVHKVMVGGLGITENIRKNRVGISGSQYQPLSLELQIKEAMDVLVENTKHLSDSYSQALALVTGISYIQPFTDGNKRTARMMANAVLLADDKAMLSYRTVDEVDYKKRMLIFYEVGSLVPMKELFIEQYEYAAGHYARKLDI